MGSDYHNCPDLGKKCSQAGLRPTERRDHRLKCQNVCLECFPKCLCCRWSHNSIRALRYSQFNFLLLKIRSNPDLRQSWAPGFVNIISKNTIQLGFAERSWNRSRKSMPKKGNRKAYFDVIKISALNSVGPLRYARMKFKTKNRIFWKLCSQILLPGLPEIRIWPDFVF